MPNLLFTLLCRSSLCVYSSAISVLDGFEFINIEKQNSISLFLSVFFFFFFFFFFHFCCRYKVNYKEGPHDNHTDSVVLNSVHFRK